MLTNKQKPAVLDGKTDQGGGGSAQAAASAVAVEKQARERA